MKRAISILFVIVLVAGCVENIEREVYTKEFFGNTFYFRANLVEAEKIPVYPNESFVRDILLQSYVSDVTINYLPNETENVAYANSGFEFGYKYTIVTRAYFGEPVRILTIELDDEDERIPNSYQVPAIAFVGPLLTEETKITADDNIVKLHAVDLSKKGDNTYNDLDLVMAKLFLILMQEPEDLIKPKTPLINNVSVT